MTIPDLERLAIANAEIGIALVDAITTINEIEKLLRQQVPNLATVIEAIEVIDKYRDQQLERSTNANEKPTTGPSARQEREDSTG